MREHPTLPSDEALQTVQNGELWPAVFCSFKNCDWHDEHGDEDALAVHLLDTHAEDLQPIAAIMLRGDAPDACLSIYKAAISHKCRSQAPVAGCSIDRGALKAFSDSFAGEKVEALICFCCARRFTFVSELAKEDKTDIAWRQPLQTNEEGKLYFLNQPAEKVANILSLNTFLERYDKVSSAGRRMTDSEDFADWTLSLHGLAEQGPLLCCPEELGFGGHADFAMYLSKIIVLKFCILFIELLKHERKKAVATQIPKLSFFPCRTTGAHCMHTTRMRRSSARIVKYLSAGSATWSSPLASCHH